MEYLFIYLLQVADLIRILAYFLLTITIIHIVFSVLCLISTSEDNRKIDESIEDVKVCGKVLLFLAIPTILLFLTPSKETLLLMGGTYIGKKAINTTINSEAFQKTNSIINSQLDKYIKKLERGKLDEKTK